LAREGKSPEAIAEFLQALKISPHYEQAANNLLDVLGKR